jgi:hypothetical protein
MIGGNVLIFDENKALQTIVQCFLCCAVNYMIDYHL